MLLVHVINLNRILIEVANSSRFVVHRKSITKPDQVVQRTVALMIHLFLKASDRFINFVTNE